MKNDPSARRVSPDEVFDPGDDEVLRNPWDDYRQALGELAELGLAWCDKCRKAHEPIGCEVCHDTGWVRRELAVGQPGFGIPLACECRRYTSEAREARVRACMLPRDMQHQTFASFKPVKGTQGALRAAREYAAHPDGRWLSLWGSVGCGKTHLMAGIANAVLGDPESTTRVRYWSVPDMLYRVTENDWEQRDQILLQAERIDVLLLDEFGSQRATPWALDTVERLVNQRYQNQRATVFGVTVTEDELRLALPRVLSRMNDAGISTVVQITAGDYRHLKGQDDG